MSFPLLRENKMRLASVVLVFVISFANIYANDEAREKLLSSFKVNVPEYYHVSFGGNPKKDDDYLENLIKVICQYEGSDSKPNRLSDVTVYKSLIGDLDDKQGTYIERISRDVIIKILIDKTISLLLKGDTKDAKEIISFMDGKLDPTPALNQLLSYHRKNKEMDELTLSDLSQFDLLLGGDMTKSTTRSLLQSKNETILSKRIIYSHFMFEYYLKGVSTFLNKGGEFSKLKIADNQYFKSVMKDEKFSYPVYKIKSFRNSDIISFLDLTTNKDNWALANQWLKN